MDEIELSGLRIAFRREGSGPPLVLLHGFLCDSRSWRPQIEGLADAFTVVAWDAPGCGRSDDAPETFSLADYADRLADFLAAVGVERPHVGGLSWGGGLALELARRHPELPRSLILADAYAGWAGSLPPAVVAERLERARLDSQRPPAEVAGRFVPELLTDAAPPEMADEVARITSDFHPAGLRAMARAIAEADLRDALRSIRIPALLIWGEHDVRSPLTIAHEFHAALPDARLVVIPAVGHLSNLEGGARFNAEVRAFVESLDRASPSGPAGPATAGACWRHGFDACVAEPL